MTSAKFLEIVGNASTTAFLDKKKLGYNVNACAYQTEDGQIKLVLESNGETVKGIPAKFMTQDEYQMFKDAGNNNLFKRGIELFGARTIFTEKN